MEYPASLLNKVLFMHLVCSTKIVPDGQIIKGFNTSFLLNTLFLFRMFIEY